MTIWCSAGLMAVAALAFVPPAGMSFAVLFPAWVPIVASSIALSAVGIAAAIDRIARAESTSRGMLTVAASGALTALTAWSLWMALGPRATGTLHEAVPLVVDPIVAAVLTLFLLRDARTAAVAALVAAGLTLVIVGRFVATVGPTYGA
jgi:hypothetical protein